MYIFKRFATDSWDVQLTVNESALSSTLRTNTMLIICIFCSHNMKIVHSQKNKVRQLTINMDEILHCMHESGK